MTDLLSYVLNEKKNPDKSLISITIFLINMIGDKSENRSRLQEHDSDTQLMTQKLLLIKNDGRNLLKIIRKNI